MVEGKRWTRDELLVVLNLYEKLQFGQFHARQPIIIDVAVRMGRTPGSVAMKLSNLASLDPKVRARGIVGLEGASNFDKKGLGGVSNESGSPRLDERRSHAKAV